MNGEVLGMMKKNLLLGVAASTLIGCTLHPDILSAHAYRVDGNEFIELSLQSRDAYAIKNRQLYFSIVVIECGGGQSRFPMEPYIAGQRAAEFKFPTTGQDVKITGSMPATIFQKYSRPCVLLEGGGYLSGNLISVPVPIAGSKEAGVEFHPKLSPFAG